MGHPGTGDARDLSTWRAQVQMPDWPGRVLEASLAHIADLPTVTFVRSMVTGTTLNIVYRQAGRPGLLGIRRDLTRPPPVGDPPDDLADWLAAWIATIEIVEPPGRGITTAEVDIDGVQWRGLPHHL